MGEGKLQDLKEKALNMLKQKKVVTILLIVGLVGILLIFLSEFLGGNDSAASASADTKTITMSEYEAVLEGKIHAIIGKIEGVGKAEVLVTIENGVEYVYVTEEKKSDNSTNNTYEENVVLINGKEALIEKEIEPKIRGVVIVCEGGNNFTVKQQVTQAVTTAFDVGANKVCITQGNS